MRHFRTYNEVPDPAGAEVLDQVLAQRARLQRRLADIRCVIAIASGKGGVGKSAVTANLAAALAERGHAVGAVDADLNGPSLARMLNAARDPLGDTADGVAPAPGAAGVRVISMDLLLAADNTPVRWKEPHEGAFIWQSALETGALREFISDVAWGTLDYLLVDVPPGTDKIERLLQLVPAPAAFIIVTTPSETARFVVSKSVRLVHEAGISRVGLVANMTLHTCGACGHTEPLFGADGAERLAAETGVPLWAELPFDARLAETTDAGAPMVLAHPDAHASAAFRMLAARVETETNAHAEVAG
jgi:ATP-binding protein involved in chromosome partitioning